MIVKKNVLPALILLSGYLGAGKTTSLNYLLSNLANPAKTVVLVNEVGEINFDARLLKQHGLPLYELTSGCICCSLDTDLIKTLTTVLDNLHPRLILLEASGIAEPQSIHALLHSPQLWGRLGLIKAVTVLDARLWRARAALGALFFGQLAQSDFIILNKSDLVDPETLQSIVDDLEANFAPAKVASTTHGKVDSKLILDCSEIFQKRNRPLWADFIGSMDADSDFSIFSYHSTGCFSQSALDHFLKYLPPEVIRIKGTINCDGEIRYLNYVAGQIAWGNPPWQACSTELVFIGKQMDCNQIDSGLADLLKL